MASSSWKKSSSGSSNQNPWPKTKATSSGSSNQNPKATSSGSSNQNRWALLENENDNKSKVFEFEFTTKISMVHDEGGIFHGKSICMGQLERVLDDVKIPVSLISVLREDKVFDRCITWENSNTGALEVINEVPNPDDSKSSYLVTKCVSTFAQFWKGKADYYKNNVNNMSWWKFIKDDFDLIFRGLRRNILSCFLDGLSSASEEIFISSDLSVSFLPIKSRGKSEASYINYRNDINDFIALVVSVLLYPQNQGMVKRDHCFDHSLDGVVPDYDLACWLDFVMTKKISQYVVDETSACVYLMSSYFLKNVDKAHFLLVVNEHLKLKWLESGLAAKLLEPVCLSSDFDGEDRIRFYKGQKDRQLDRSALIKSWGKSTPQWKMALYHFGPDELFRVLRKPDSSKDPSKAIKTYFGDCRSAVPLKVEENRTSNPVHHVIVEHKDKKTVKVQDYEQESDILRFCVNALHHTNEYIPPKTMESHDIVDGLQRTFPRLFVNMHRMLLTYVSRSISNGEALFNSIYDKRKFAAQLVGHESPTFSGVVCSCVFCHHKGK